MNLRVIQWLIAHRELLLNVVEAAKDFDKDSAYIKQWEIVDRIARIVIPALDESSINVNSMVSDWYDDEVQAFGMGAQVAALGVDWQTLINIVLPILVAILKALADKDDDE